MPIKTFTPSVLTSADVNTYLMQQAVITCTSSTRPSSPVNGMTIYETDTECYATYSGSAWVYRLGGTWSTYTPGFGNITLGNGTTTGRYTRIGKTIIGRMRFQAGSTTTYGGGTFSISLPTAFETTLTGLDQLGTGAVDNGSVATRRLVQLTPILTASVNMAYEGGAVTSTTPFTFGTSSRISIHFAYEAA